MRKNNYEKEFNKNIGLIINNKISELNKYSEVIREILCEDDRNRYLKKLRSFKLTDIIIVEEINKLFGEDCFTDRTYMNIKHATTSSSAFNVFIIIYVLNDLVNQVNQEYLKYGGTEMISLIDIDDITDPLLNA